MEKVYTKKENISEQKLGNELMLYDSASDKVHVLNQTGAYVWELFDGKRTLVAVKNCFIERFKDTPEDTIKKDLEDIIKLLIKESLIQ